MENKSAKFFKHSSGFTLVELLVVIAIVGVLSSIVAMGYAGQLKKARDGKRKADLEIIRSALEIYRSDCRTYPASLPVAGSSLTGIEASCAGNQYMAVIPADPSSGSYAYTPGTNTYSLCASLEICSGCATVTCTSGNCGSSCNYKVSNP